MIKFPSIDQFRHTIRRVKDVARFDGRDDDGNPIYDESRPIPTLPFRGYVKIHGTNAGVVYDVETGAITYQSRERVITPGDDNSGFAAYMSQHEDVIKEIVDEVLADNDWWYGRTDSPTHVAIFGEWCGRGIMRGTAVNELDRMFVVFAIKVVFEDQSFWFDMTELVENVFDKTEYYLHYPDQRIFNVATFGWYTLDIDFNRPELAQNHLIEMTSWVEEKCPVGAYFGIEGIGEGIVWHCTHHDWNGDDVWFKVKGEKHSTSKVKTLNPVDVEAVKKMDALVDAVVTEARLEWAVENLVREQKKPLEMSSMGDFIRTVYNDVVKEELDVIEAAGFDQKKLGGPVANRARPWFVRRINETVDA